LIKEERSHSHLGGGKGNFLEDKEHILGDSCLPYYVHRKMIGVKMVCVKFVFFSWEAENKFGGSHLPGPCGDVSG